MSKWRPSKECIYAIPDIHGMYEELNLILSRILPLRRTGGVHDKIVFLGDYIDRGGDSHKVLDLLISLKKEYKDQIITLWGNHEIMFLDGIQPHDSSKPYKFWMSNGGDMTLSGYLKRCNYKNIDEIINPYLFPRQRIKDMVPKEHIDFLMSLEDYHETDDFIFVHGGCNPLHPMNNNLSHQQVAAGIKPRDLFTWDRSLFKFMNRIGADKEFDFTWNKCIVTGHNGDTGNPFISSKYMMLDCSCSKKLLVMEMNSLEAFYARKGKKKLVKLEF